MTYLCPHPCDGKTEYGYCRYTWCINPLHSNLGTAQQGQGVQKAVVTNADRIRAMSDEELAELFVEYGKRNDCCPDFGRVNCRESCEECWLDWLRQEATP